MTPVTRQHRARVAAELRAEGLTQEEIAAQMGVSRSYVSDLLTDPDGSAAKARKDRYRGTCADCGAPTDGSNGRTGQPQRCRTCNQADPPNRFWTRDAILDAIHEWVATHGSPPAATDWHPSQARRIGHHDRADRFYTDGCWPHLTSVKTQFGGWNAAIRAAGYTPRRPGEYDRGQA